MKLHFESDLDYQNDAIEAVCDIFKGAETLQAEMTLTPISQQLLEYENSPYLSSPVNPVIPDGSVLLNNIRDIQLRNQLPPSESLDSYDFTVEMETGTGKTYVYLRTIMELNKRYGMTKFIIIVPSVAIKEGTIKTLEMTKPHFHSLYSGVPYEFYPYDSSNPGCIRDFVTSSQMRIMVMTIGAINKKEVNKLYQSSEKTTIDELDKPIELLQSTRPVLIVDEPQSVDGGSHGAGKQALEAIKPLFTLRYSATHIHKHNMVYKLDAIDAYQRRLVKQIEVAGLTIQNANNQATVVVIDIQRKRNQISAVLALDIQRKDGSVASDEVTVISGDDLADITGRAIYQHYRIDEIRYGKKDGYVALETPGGIKYLAIGDTLGHIDAMQIQRQMIRRTLREHFDKELRFNQQGIKVLSLFFIDKVDYYRHLDDDGRKCPGLYAQIFEEEYQTAINSPAYRELAGRYDDPVNSVHDGYFSVDKKGGWAETSESNATGRDNAERGYHLIMQAKEKLLSLENPVRFIFSHSALKEGWDNPNVFQICSLREMGSERERRQTLGRGLRLCVNQQGERVRDDNINILTVVAGESYEDYAHRLQNEIELETGVMFGQLPDTAFAHLSWLDDNNQRQVLNSDGSVAVCNQLKKNGYLSSDSFITDKLKTALRDSESVLSDEYTPVHDAVCHILKKYAGHFTINNADKRKSVRTRRAVLDSEAFRSLWERINTKTLYRLRFNDDKLIRSCINAISLMPRISRAVLVFSKGRLNQTLAGVEAESTGQDDTRVIRTDEQSLPDILGILQEQTGLTRQSLVRILKDSRRLADFTCNPQAFISNVSAIINDCKRTSLVDGIEYERLSDQVYAQTLFTEKELVGYTKRLLETAKDKSVYVDVLVDSKPERDFVQALEDDDNVKVYTKLPNWFKIPTPLGQYNPDWALVYEHEGEERIYFVAETKSDLVGLREEEKAKIRCGKAHFTALSHQTDNPARYHEVTNYPDLIAKS